MTRDEAIDRLRALEPDLRARGIASLFLFGSTARNTAQPLSDVDVLFGEPPGRAMSLLGLAGTRRFLRERLGVEVDLVDRRTVHFMLRDRIEAEAIPIFS
ncbi:MAG: nucleotidyltransferase domain-containing protein [Hyphomonadaceae bacterium]|nr:nucleotidyltransferase domain-containing protein [Hyphomonadaceae bacterium]